MTPFKDSDAGDDCPGGHMNIDEAIRIVGVIPTLKTDLSQYNMALDFLIHEARMMQIVREVFEAVSTSISHTGKDYAEYQIDLDTDSVREDRFIYDNTLDGALLNFDRGNNAKTE